MEKNENQLKDDLLSIERKLSLITKNSIFGFAFLDKDGNIITSNLQLQNLLEGSNWKEKLVLEPH